MLTTMIIKNLAVISHMEIQFSDGFIVLTGETGAGKSILIDALAAIMGARFPKEIIRKDEKSTLVEAAFYFPEDKECPAVLSEYLVDNSLIISREIFRDGRNVVKLNGSLSNTAVLRSLAPYLISIHSQNDNQALFNSEIHYLFLDHYAGNAELFRRYQEQYHCYKEILKEISDLETQKEQDNSRIDYLKFVISEIEAAELQPNEEEQLKLMKSAMKNREQYEKNIKTATYALYEEEQSAYNLVALAEHSLKNMEGFEEILVRLGDLKYEISELSDRIRKQMSDSEADYRNPDEIEERLDCIYRLKAKYGGTFDAVLEYLEKAKDELYRIEHRETHLEELAEKSASYKAKLKELAEELSERRKASANELSCKLSDELHDLMMPNAVFQIQLTPESAFRPYGIEKVEFLFSANLGMAPQPLSKIASGGEISRVNLALKSVLRGIDPACAFVFDEIDTGLSGRAAQKTGEKMYSIASTSQVLCVTHLPQIAAMADQHILVAKEEKEEETVTTVHTISEEERVSELSRMIGGVCVTELTRRNAEEILELARNFKAGKV